jgi:hypothetical protein
LGAKPNPIGKITDADYQNLDCLICHGEDYTRTVEKEGDRFRIVPAPGVDILHVAQSVGKPTDEMCLRCHVTAGSGPNHLYGDTPTRDADIHTAKGLTCVDCHKTKNHRIPGGSDLKAQEMSDEKVDCTKCHQEPVHKGQQAEYLSSHTKRIACQTCHIPMIARDFNLPTITSRDWTKPTPMTNGLYTPTNTWAIFLKPAYRWWNRFMKDPPCPVGSLDDPKSKITPWKITTYTVIADAQTGQPLSVDAGAYSVTGDPAIAARKGSQYGNQKYSGIWKGIPETVYTAIDHQVSAKGRALTCIPCHSVKGVMDFKTLGYSDEKVKALTTERAKVR